VTALVGLLQLWFRISTSMAWDEVTEPERRVLVEELVERVAVSPDHLEVSIAGATRLNAGFADVGLGDNQSQNVGVGEPMSTISDWRLEPWAGT